MPESCARQRLYEEDAAIGFIDPLRRRGFRLVEAPRWRLSLQQAGVLDEWLTIYFADVSR